MEPLKDMLPSLRSLASGLGQPRLAAVPPFPGFPAFDADEIAQELDLYVRAAEAAQRGEPASTAELPDAIETEIEAAIESQARVAALAYETQLAEHDAAICRTFLTDDECLEIEASCRSLFEELEARVQATHARLLAFWKQHVETADAELQLFRNHNGLEKPPKLVSRGGQLIRGLVLVGLGCVAAFVSWRLMAAGESGLAAAVPSLVLSLLNVGSAAWYARRGLPLLLARGVWSKLRGTVTTVAFVGWLLAVNVLAVHFRDALLAERSGAFLVELWHRISLQPLGPAPSSWLLAILGLGSSTIALFIAAGMDELYPGYGAVGRRLAAAQAAYRTEVSTCSAELAVIQGTAMEDLQAMNEAIQCRKSESNTAVQARCDFHGEFLDHLDQLAAAHDHLCCRYREVNAAVQGDNVPRYFALDVERPACLAGPVLADLTRGRDDWVESIDRVQHYWQMIASLFAADAPSQVEVAAVPQEMEVEVSA